MIRTNAASIGRARAPSLPEVRRSVVPLIGRVWLLTGPPLLALVLILGEASSYAGRPFGLLPLVALLAVAGAAAAAQAVAVAGRYPTELRIDRTGLALRFRRYEVEAPWSHWALGRTIALTGGLSLSCGDDPPRLYAITRAQARALLQFRADGGAPPAPSPGGTGPSGTVEPPSTL